MSNYAYNILISRIDEGGEQDVLIDRDITADEAINAILNQKHSDAGAPEKVEAKLEPTVPVLAEKKATRVYERKVNYDMNEVKDDVISGMTVPAIAAKHNVTNQIIYNIRLKMKKAGEWGPEIKEEQVAAGSMNDELAMCLSNEEKVTVMLKHGMTPDDVYKRMHDFMTDREFREAVEAYDGAMLE